MNTSNKEKTVRRKSESRQWTTSYYNVSRTQQTVAYNKLCWLDVGKGVRRTKLKNALKKKHERSVYRTSNVRRNTKWVKSLSKNS